MLVYRALNEFDDMWIGYNHILSTAWNEKDESKYMKERRKVIRQNAFFDENIIYIMSYIIGHTGGQLLKSGRSPWISITKSFDIALEYASLERCKNDIETTRAIVCFEIDDDKVIDYDSSLVFKDFEKVKNGYVIDTGKGNLNSFYQAGMIPRYSDCESLINNNSTLGPKRTRRLTQSNYSFHDDELIVFNKIRLKDKVVLTPNEVDLLKEDKNERQRVIKEISSATSLDDVRKILSHSKQKILSRK